MIDVKFIKPDNEFALLSSNSESLKLLEFATNKVELYPGHSDIILTVDVLPAKQLCLTGSKDN